MLGQRCSRCLLAVGLAFNAAISLGLNPHEVKAAELIKPIQIVETAQAATVVLVPVIWQFRFRLSEATLKESGCTFTTREPGHIASLISLLAASDIMTAKDSDKFWEPREGIFLTLPDGTEAKFLLSALYTGTTAVRGVFINRPNPENLHVTGAPSLPRDLAVWAADTGLLSARNGQRQRSCEYHLKRMKATNSNGDEK